MKIELKKDDKGIDIVTLQGDLDFHSSPELRTEFVKLADAQAPTVLVDLKKVNYVDSSGLAAFVELFQKMKRYNGKLVLYNLSPGVKSVFEIAKLDSIFRLAASEKEALSLIS